MSLKQGSVTSPRGGDRAGAWAFSPSVLCHLMTVLGAWGLCRSVHPTEFLLLRRDVGRWLGRHGGGDLDPECTGGQGGSLVYTQIISLPPHR